MLQPRTRRNEVKDTSEGTLAATAHLRDTDTYVHRHWMREHTSRARTHSEDT